MLMLIQLLELEMSVFDCPQFISWSKTLTRVQFYSVLTLHSTSVHTPHTAAHIYILICPRKSFLLAAINSNYVICVCVFLAKSPSESVRLQMASSILTP